MRLKPIFVVLISVLILSACGGSQSALKKKDLKTETLKAIVKNYNKSAPEFKTMRGRIKGLYNDGSQQQNINISYRFKKDKTLWMSAKFAGFIQVAKMMITPQNIKFYERLDNSYFDGDFELVSSFLGLELNYNQIENMFTGQALKNIDVSNTDFQTADEYFQMVTTYENGLTQFLLLDAKTFKIKQQALSLDDRQIKIIYKSYQVVDGFSFPEEFVILAGDNNEQIQITLTYKNIKLNEDLKFPFKFPNNYSPIQLN
ncbi:DUF4292 domain-containing protein [Mesohalobacter salilacus]|uniref:DUF4292 domain-containing protein n=1 Tax=Mesohalobacter salilacus TaxID=2491711 RepID=UPI002680F4D5